MKKVIVLTLSLLIGLSSVAYGAVTLKLFSNGKQLKEVPIVVSGKTYVPLSALNRLGVKTSNSGGKVTINLPPPPKPVIQYKLTSYMLDLISQSVYPVYGSTDTPGTYKQGSSFIVKGTLITNYHVAGDSPYAKVTIDNVPQQVSTYEFANKDRDLMGFKVQGGKELPISTDLPKVGETVYAIGFPNNKLQISEGYVKTIRLLGGENIIFHTAAIDHGSSGGILLNGKGEIIGVNSNGTVSEGENYNSAIPSIYVLEQFK